MSNIDLTNDKVRRNFLVNSMKEGKGKFKRKKEVIVFEGKDGSEYVVGEEILEHLAKKQAKKLAKKESSKKEEEEDGQPGEEEEEEVEELKPGVPKIEEDTEYDSVTKKHIIENLRHHNVAFEKNDKKSVLMKQLKKFLKS